MLSPPPPPQKKKRKLKEKKELPLIYVVQISPADLGQVEEAFAAERWCVEPSHVNGAVKSFLFYLFITRSLCPCL